MADILWSNIVGDKTVEGNGGYLGDLLTVARAHVDDAVSKSRITQAQAGEIYTAMIPAAMQQAVQFEMSEALTEAQVADTLKKTELAEAESLLNQTIQGKQSLKLDEEIDLLQTQDLTAIYEKDNILPANLASIEKDTDVKERQMLETEAAGIKQRLLLDEEKETSDKNQAILDKQLTDIDTKNDLAVLNAQLSAWSQTYNSGKSDNVPSILDNDKIAAIAAKVGIV